MPASQTFFALELPPLVVWLAGIGIAALTWFFARLFVPTVQPGMQLGEGAPVG